MSRENSSTRGRTYTAEGYAALLRAVQKAGKKFCGSAAIPANHAVQLQAPHRERDGLLVRRAESGVHYVSCVYCGRSAFTDGRNAFGTLVEATS